MGRHLGRRLVLVSGGALAAAVAVAGGAGVVACRVARRETAALRVLHAATEEMFDPVGLGRAHLAERGVAALAEEAAGDPELAEICRIDCPHARNERLRAPVPRGVAQRSDLELPGGWVVARTEALIAALWVAEAEGRVPPGEGALRRL